MDRDLILLTGASGYVGGRLRHSLEAAWRPLRCMARRPAELRARVAESTDVVAGDVLDPATLPAALRGVHTAYYLIHGETDWYHGRRLWWIRGQLDRLAGGPGLRRGRRDPTSVFVG